MKYVGNMEDEEEESLNGLKDTCSLHCSFLKVSVATKRDYFFIRCHLFSLLHK